MRKSTALTLAIMLIAFGAMFAAAGSALGPLAKDAEVSKALTRMLASRGDVAEGTRVRVHRLVGGKDRLAAEGRGLVVRLTPSPTIGGRRGGLRLLAMRVGQEGLQSFPATRLDWVEVEFELEKEPQGTAEAKTLRTLLRLDEGRLMEPAPGLPVQL